MSVAKTKRKSSFFALKTIIPVILFMALVASGTYYHKLIVRYSYKVYRVYKRIVYPHKSFNPSTIEPPLGYTIFGVDVSHYQEDIDWANAYAKSQEGDSIPMQFAFIKATQGIWREDIAFEENWTLAAEQKITRGAYHYFEADKDAGKQAANFISSVKLESGDLPPVIDIEETAGISKTKLVSTLKIYISEIEKNYKVKPILYSNINFIEDYLLDDFADYHFWVAHYYEDDLSVPQECKWLFWQFTDKGNIKGCSQKIDMNVFYGNKADLKDYLIK